MQHVATSHDQRRGVGGVQTTRHRALPGTQASAQDALQPIRGACIGAQPNRRMLLTMPLPQWDILDGGMGVERRILRLSSNARPSSAAAGRR